MTGICLCVHNGKVTKNKAKPQVNTAQGKLYQLTN